jgi:hypothetical protein
MLPLKNDNGVNILLEYLFSLMVMVILFSLMIMTIGNVMNNTDRIVLKEEFDIVANDLANRITAFSDEITLTKQTAGINSTTTVDSHTVYFDLPELVSGKQYVVDVSYNNTLKSGTVTVTYASNINIYSIATFNTTIPVNSCHFYSQQGKYGIYYLSNNTIDVGNNA